MTENARRRYVRIDNCITTLPISVDRCLAVMQISGDKVLTCFCDDENSMWGYNPRWTKIRQYMKTDNFSRFIQRDGMKFDLTFVLHPAH